VRSFAASQREVLRKDGSRTLDVLVNNAGRFLAGLVVCVWL